MEDAKELGRVLSKYKDTNYYEVMLAFFITYILYPFLIHWSLITSCKFRLWTVGVWGNKHTFASVLSVTCVVQSLQVCNHLSKKVSVNIV